ncbi:MAG TPA: SAM-dependent methyltransferase [Polyangia bacterium]|jgi:methyltransferase (TIGR00027 family)
MSDSPPDPTDDSPIRHVSDTAFWVATYRANEGERKDALFSDPLAARLVEGRGRQIAARMSDTKMLAWMIPIRTRIIDDLVAQAIADGCDLVVNLGAGLDTRPYRLELPATLTWIEVDFAETIAFKEARLAGEPARCRLERASVDLADTAARRAFLDGVAARAKKALVLTEGVIPYLSNDETAALADDLRARDAFAWWIVEYIERRPPISRARRRQMAAAPFRFSPGDWTAFFAAHGWHMQTLRSYGDEARRHRRPPPFDWKVRLLLALAPRRTREKWRRGYGFAVLARS